MEFDNNSPVSDEQRRLAESKKITLQPVHADIQPDDPSGSEIAARHVNGPAIPNLKNDTEQNKASIQPSKGLLSQLQAVKKMNGYTATIVTVATLSALITCGFFFFS